MRMRTHKLGDVQIEAWIVDQYHHIGLPSHNVILTTLHVGKDSAQVHQYGYKTHVSQLAIVLHPRTAHCRHQVTAKNGIQPAHLLASKPPSSATHEGRPRLHQRSDNTS